MDSLNNETELQEDYSNKTNNYKCYVSQDLDYEDNGDNQDIIYDDDNDNGNTNV